MYDNSGLGWLVGFALFFPIFLFILLPIGYILTALFLHAIFRKAGVQTPAVAWIPIYNFMILAKLADLNPWLYLIGIGGTVVLSWIPGLNFLISLAMLALGIFVVWRISVKFGKEPVGWTIFGFFLYIIWLGVLGYGSAVWRTGTENGVPAPFWHKWGTFFRDTTTWGGVPYQGYSA